MNNLEMQLRSWAPRQPSAKLKARLFGTAVAEAQGSAVVEEEAPSFRFGWLAPATAALLLMCMLFNQRNSPVISGASSGAPMMAMIMSNQNAYVPGGFQSEQNRLPSETFEWTNGNGSTSSIGPLSVWGGSKPK